MKEENETSGPTDATQAEVKAVDGLKGEVFEDPKVEAVDEPQSATVAELGPEARAVGDGLGVEPVERPATKARKEPERRADRNGGAEDGLELDRMEVRPVVGMPEEVRPEAKGVQPVATEINQPARPSLTEFLHGRWMLILGFLLGLSLISAASLFVLVLATRQNHGEAPRQAPPEEGMQVITASLGGQHYVRFNLWGPFRDPERQEALLRGLPKVKNDLILSGGDPEVKRAIQENDLVFLERHILTIVSKATGIPQGEMDLKGLAVTRYSDDAEVQGLR